MFRGRKQFEYKYYRNPHPILSKLRKGITLLLGFFIGYYLFTSIVLKSYRVDSIAMNPTLQVGDRILASPLAYGVRLPFFDRWVATLHRPRRGDLAILTPSYGKELSYVETLGRDLLGFLTAQKFRGTDLQDEWNHPYTIKRIIGIPGDTIRMRNVEVYVKPMGMDDFVSEFSLSLRPYTIEQDPQKIHQFAEKEEILLAEDEYFVVSDHRLLGLDSRVWGPVHWQQIQSKVLFLYWPLGRLHGY